MTHRMIVAWFLLAAGFHAAAQDRGARTIDECVLVLMDPHAASSDKMRACRALYGLGDAAKPAAMALARQSLYDMEPVRDLARQTLNRLVGEVEGDRLRTLTALAGPENRIDVLRDFERIKGWEDFSRVAVGLRSDSTTIRGAAVGAMLRIWENTRTLPASRDMAVLMRAVNPDLLTALGEAYPRLQPAERKGAIELTVALGADWAQAVPLLLRALSEPDLRDLAKPPADKLFSADQTDVRMIQPLVRVAVGVTDESSRAALKYIDGFKPRGIAVAARCAIHELARGSAYAEELLRRRWGHSEHPLLAAAKFVRGIPSVRRSRFTDILAPALEPIEMRNALAPLLTGEDESVPVLAAQLAATAPQTFDPPGMLDWLILQESQVRPDVIHALMPDAMIAAARMRPWLGGSARQQATAMTVLKRTGLAGDEIRAALAPLVESADDDVRFAAAELLDRKDVLARVRVPQLLKDLRSDSHTGRALAARQLDELGVEPREVTAALIRAVDRRDLAARVGLVDAVAAAHRDRRNSLEVLKGLSESAQGPQGAFARAGLREVVGNVPK